MKEKVQEIIKLVLLNSDKPIDQLKFDSESKLREDLGMDSFNLAELTVHIEEEFGVDIFEDGIVNTLEEVYSKLEVKGE